MTNYIIAFGLLFLAAVSTASGAEKKCGITGTDYTIRNCERNSRRDNTNAAAVNGWGNKSTFGRGVDLSEGDLGRNPMGGNALGGNYTGKFGGKRK